MENFQNTSENNLNQPIPEPRKGIPTWLGLGIIIVIAVLAGGGIWAYQYYTQNQNSNPVATGTPTPTPQNETAGWQTYVNEEYGFELKYPNGFSPELLDGSIRFLKDNDETVWNGFDVRLIEPSESCDSEKYAKSILRAGDSSYSQITLSETGQKVTQVRNKYGNFDVSYVTFIPAKDCDKSKRMISISGSEKYLNDYNIFLSTFKFIEPKIYSCGRVQNQGIVSKDYFIGKKMQVVAASGATGTFDSDGTIKIKMGCSVDDICPSETLYNWEIKNGEIIIKSLTGDIWFSHKDIKFYNFNNSVIADIPGMYVGQSFEKISEYIDCVNRGWSN